MGYNYNFLNCPYGAYHSEEFATYIAGENIWILAECCLACAHDAKALRDKYEEEGNLSYFDRHNYEAAHYSFGLYMYELFRNVAELHAFVSCLKSTDDDDDDTIHYDKPLAITDCAIFYIEANKIKKDEYFDITMGFILKVHEACQPYCENIFHNWVEIIKPLADIWLEYGLNIYHHEFGQLVRRISEMKIEDFRGAYERENWRQSPLWDYNVDDKYTVIPDAPTELPLDLGDDNGKNNH